MNTHDIKSDENKIQASAGSILHQSSNGESGIKLEDNRPATITQRQLQDTITSTPSISKGVSLDVLSHLPSMSTSYAMAIIKKEMASYPKAMEICLSVLGFTLYSLNMLSGWLVLVRQAYGTIKSIAAIPRGVVAVFLWGIGKLFLWFADKVYNKGKVAYFFGDVTEDAVYEILSTADATHVGMQKFIEYVQTISGYVSSYLSGNMNDPKDSPKDAKEKTEDKGEKKITAPSFFSLQVDTPTLTKWKKDDTTREGAGLEAKASAHLILLGQKMGGDVDIKLPFGSGWQIAIQNFFKSSSFGLTCFKVDYISGDTLVFNDNGLEKAGMSIHGLKVGNGTAGADKLSVVYNKGKAEIAFSGEGSLNLWGKNKGNLSAFLNIKTDGTFESAGLAIVTEGSTEIIPGYLEIIDPKGNMVIHNNKAPDLGVGAKVIVKGIPGIGKTEAKGGVSFIDNKLEGSIENLNLYIPLGKKAKLKIVIEKAIFNNEEVTAENAYIDFDYDKNIEDDKEVDPGKTAKDIFTADLSWLDVSQFVDLEKLSIHQGLTKFNMKGGKLGYTKDEKNGLRALKAKVLGISAEYDEEKKKGSLSGSVKKEIGGNLVKIDFPLGPMAGAYFEVKGNMVFEASLLGSIQKNTAKSSDKITAMQLSGETEAKAGAGLSLHGGGFFGIPYLATIKGGLYGKVDGSVAGKVNMEGGLLYNKDNSKINKDPTALPKGNFLLKGLLTAEVGGEIKAQVLVFEKDILSVKLGDWQLGSYELIGEILSDENGMPTFNVKKQDFAEKPKSPPAVPKPIPLTEWLDKLTQSNGRVKYDKDPEKKIGRVARDIVYGNYSPAQKANIQVKYHTLLDSGDRVIFIAEYSRLEAMRSANYADSFVWSAEEWKKATNMRTILGFEQSESKKKVYDLIETYHQLPSSNKSGKLAALSEIEKVIDNYINNRSKVPENKLQASQLSEQIKMEKEKIEHSKLG